MDDLAQEFWSRVKILIKTTNTTQEGLAKSADLNFNNLKQQIFYNRMPDAAQAYRIAKALNTTVEFLVTGENSTPKPDTTKIIQTIESALEQAKNL